MKYLYDNGLEPELLEEPDNGSANSEDGQHEDRMLNLQVK